MHRPEIMQVFTKEVGLLKVLFCLSIRAEVRKLFEEKVSLANVNVLEDITSVVQNKNFLKGIS